MVLGKAIVCMLALSSAKSICSGGGARDNRALMLVGGSGDVLHINR